MAYYESIQSVGDLYRIQVGEKKCKTLKRLTFSLHFWIVQTWIYVHWKFRTGKNCTNQWMSNTTKERLSKEVLSFENIFSPYRGRSGGYVGPFWTAIFLLFKDRYLYSATIDYYFRLFKKICTTNSFHFECKSIILSENKRLFKIWNVKGKFIIRTEGDWNISIWHSRRIRFSFLRW